jgi:hypothetical protein
MTNSHAVEALARAAVTYAPHLRAAAAELTRRFVRMMFHGGELGRPNSYEHYNPVTGRASVYRGIDDYQHSWVADLIVQYVMGVRPHDGGITIDPLPFALERAELTGVLVRGASVNVWIDGDQFVVTADHTTYEGRLGTPVEIGQ